MQLSDVLATPLLFQRSLRRPPKAMRPHSPPTRGHASRRAAISQIVGEAMLDRGAHSAGLSLFRMADCDELAWFCAQGALAEFQGRRFPLRHSLCGVCFDHGATQLFIEPHLYFQWIAQAGIFISEALVAPLRSPGGTLYGTIWTMCHWGASIQFDSSDARRLEERGRQVNEAIWPPSAA